MQEMTIWWIRRQSYLWLVVDKYRERLLAIKDLNLKTATDICRAAEMAKAIVINARKQQWGTQIESKQKLAKKPNV